VNQAEGVAGGWLNEAKGPIFLSSPFSFCFRQQSFFLSFPFDSELT
jgi:hypothetical protein